MTKRGQQGQIIHRDQYNAGRDINIYYKVPAIIGGFLLVIAIAIMLTIPDMRRTVSSYIQSFLLAASGDKILIVVTTFHETGATKTEPHTKIRREIEKAAEEIDNLRVVEDPIILKADEREAAEALGNRYKAGIVIWGEDTGAEVIVNFLNLKQPNAEAAAVEIPERTRVQLTADPEPYNRFILEDLPNQLAFLSLFAVGQSHYIQEDYLQALPIIENAVTSLIENSQLETLKPQMKIGVSAAYMQLGWINQLELNNPQQGIVYYNEALKFDPENLLAHNNLGASFFKLEKWADALESFNNAIALDQNIAWLHYNRGNVYYNQGDFEQAIANYSKATTLNLDYSSAYFNRGIAYSDLRNFPEAIKDFNQVIERGEDPEAYYNRGNAYYHQDELERAKKDFDQAIDLSPDYVDALNYSCWTASLLEKAAEAMADCDRAVELRLDDGWFRDSRGVALALVGRYEEAREEFLFFIEWAARENEKEEFIIQRQQWIDQLEKRQNPFTKEVLQGLR